MALEESIMESVTDTLRWQIEAKQRFVSIEVGWSKFLHYLNARNASDIRGVHRCEEIDGHLEWIDSIIDDPDANRENDEAISLEEFGRRDDVIEAFHIFAEHETLALP
jgi:hypothetical protein